MCQNEVVAQRIEGVRQTHGLHASRVQLSEKVWKHDNNNDNMKSYRVIYAYLLLSFFIGFESWFIISVYL